jgi:hypothetical protein
MALIMCTQKLLKALGKQARPPGKPAEPQLLGVRLGSWAAKTCRFDRRDLVITIEQRTYLTLVFPLAPRTGFRAHFADALAALLTDLGAPDDLVHTECSAMDVDPLSRLTDRKLIEALDTVEFMCGIELSYHDDLRRVQRNLNEFPHAGLDPCVPLEAVARVFATTQTQPSRLLH